MLKYWRQILFFVNCLLFFLLVNLPVSLVLDRVELPPQLRLYQVSGTLFEGGLGQLRVNEFVLQDVEYDWQGSCLLSLRWCYRVKAPEGDLSLGLGLLNQQITVSDLDVRYAVEDITPLIPNLLVQPTGDLRLQATNITLDDLKPSGIDAVLTWSGLGVEDGNEAMILGDYRALITGGGERLEFELQDNDALLQVSGGGSLTNNGQYELDIDLSSDEVLPDRLKSILELVARPGGYNRYRITQQGTQPNLRW